LPIQTTLSSSVGNTRKLSIEKELQGIKSINMMIICEIKDSLNINPKFFILIIYLLPLNHLGTERYYLICRIQLAHRFGSEKSDDAA
jgi:hypothetical protein